MPIKYNEDSYIEMNKANQTKRETLIHRVSRVD